MFVALFPARVLLSGFSALTWKTLPSVVLNIQERDSHPHLWNTRKAFPLEAFVVTTAVARFRKGHYTWSSRIDGTSMWRKTVTHWRCARLLFVVREAASCTGDQDRSG